MLLGIIIVGVIVALTLYDFFSTRSWQMVTSDKRNDAIFEKRNKTYGAYRIRRDYDMRVLLILLGLSGSIGGLYATSLAFNGKEIKKPKKKVSVSLLDPVEDDKDEIIEKKEAEKPQLEPTATTYRFVIPTFVDDPQTTDTAAIQDPNKDAGLYTLIGTTPIGGGTEPQFDTVTTTKPPIIPEVSPVDELAYFIGGEKAMINFIIDNINNEVQGTGTCRLRFIVGKDGSIRKITVRSKVPDCPECDKAAIDVVDKMNNKWMPGKLNGNAVDSYFSLPITFR